MTVRFLLDTNVVSEPLRPKPDPEVLARLRQHQDSLAISAVTWHELWFGCKRLPESNRRTAIERYLLEVVAPSMPVLAYDTAAAVWHAQERARLSGLGKIPPFVDGQIAAIAWGHELVLVTFNTKDFADFEEIHLEDWRS